MINTTCLHCTAATSNGLALCELCQRAASEYLEWLPVYFRNLARWKPGRAGSRPVPGSRVLYDGERSDGEGDRVTRALDEALNDVTGWARCLADDRGVVLPDRADTDVAQTAMLCRLLAENLTSIATLEWAGVFVATAGQHEHLLRGLTESVAPGWYAGACSRRIGEDACSAPTYVVPGLTWVTCRVCGSTTYARDHLETILDEARGWIARPMRISEALVALIDGELSVPRLHKRISKWGERGLDGGVPTVRRLDADGDEIGPKRFRLGDVLDRLLTEGATRLHDPVAQKTTTAS